MELNIIPNINIINNNVVPNDTIDKAGTIILLINNLSQIDIIKNNKHIKQKLKQAFEKNKDLFLWNGLLPNEKGSNILICMLQKDIQNFKFTHELMRKIKSLSFNEEEILIIDKLNNTSHIKFLLRTILASSTNMPNFKSSNKDKLKIKVIDCYSTQPINIKNILAAHAGNSLSRYLTTLPTNFLTPEKYLSKLVALSKEEGWILEIFNKEKLEDMKANAFLAVARASKHGYIIKLTYKPKISKNKKKICLVGKGICFDTGGVNIKGSQYMYGMHEDMGGSATALGTLLMLSRIKFNHEVECWLAITSNLISQNSYLPNEVITSYNGTTIEIVDTDAEGRLILADTLSIASEGAPDLIIDYATLTGASIRSVGTRYSTIFSNYSDWLSMLINSGEISGERVWPMPMTDDYLYDIQSDIADIKQCSVSPGPDHIHAAKFLELFIKDCRWLHIDLSSSMNKGGLGAVPTNFTGFGVWFSQELLGQFYNQNIN